MRGAARPLFRAASGARIIQEGADLEQMREAGLAPTTINLVDTQ